MPHRLSIPRSQKLSKVKGHYLNISNWKLVLLWLNLKQKLPNLASAWLSWALLSPSLAHSCFLFRSCVGARKLLWDLLCIMIKNCCFLALFSFWRWRSHSSIIYYVGSTKFIKEMSPAIQVCSTGFNGQPCFYSTSSQPMSEFHSCFLCF